MLLIWLSRVVDDGGGGEISDGAGGEEEGERMRMRMMAEDLAAAVDEE